MFWKATTKPVNPYPIWNWCKGMAWSVPYECAQRHLQAWYAGEDLDPETGECHLDHVICNIVMLLFYADRYREGDDRPIEIFGATSKGHQPGPTPET